MLLSESEAFKAVAAEVIRDWRSDASECKSFDTDESSAHTSSNNCSASDVVKCTFLLDVCEVGVIRSEDATKSPEP